MQQYKTCNNCLQTKQIIDFHKSSDSKDGHRARCKSCIKEFDASRYQKNLDANRERALSYYHAHKEHYAKKAAENYSTNKSAISENRKSKRANNIWHYKKLERASYERNKEKKRLAAKQYDKRHPEKARARNALRRARLNNAITYQITDREFKKLYIQPCLFCGVKENIDLDHVIPLSRSGTHGLGNLIPLCDNCNSTKYNKTIMEWRVYRIRIGNPLPNDRGIKL